MNRIKTCKCDFHLDCLLNDGTHIYANVLLISSITSCMMKAHYKQTWGVLNKATFWSTRPACANWLWCPRCPVWIFIWPLSTHIPPPPGTLCTMLTLDHLGTAHAHTGAGLWGNVCSGRWRRITTTNHTDFTAAAASTGYVMCMISIWLGFRWGLLLTALVSGWVVRTAWWKGVGSAYTNSVGLEKKIFWNIDVCFLHMSNWSVTKSAVTTMTEHGRSLDT